MVQIQRAPSLKRNSEGRRSSSPSGVAHEKSQKKVVLRGGGGVGKSKSEPALQEQDAPQMQSSSPCSYPNNAADDLRKSRTETIDDAREWLAENSERLVAQTKKCLVVHRQLQSLLGNGDGMTATAPPGSESQGFYEERFLIKQLGHSTGSSSLAYSSTASTAQTSETLAHWLTLQQRLRNELAMTNDDVERLELEIQNARDASKQFREAVQISCERELSRLDAEARELEESIAVRLKHLKQTQTPVDTLAVTPLTTVATNRPVSRSSSPSQYVGQQSSPQKSRFALGAEKGRAVPSASITAPRSSSPVRRVGQSPSPTPHLGSAMRSPISSAQISRLPSPSKDHGRPSMSPKSTEAKVLSRPSVGSSHATSQRRRSASPPSGTSATSPSQKAGASARVPVRRASSPKASVAVPPSQRHIVTTIPWSPSKAFGSTPPRNSQPASRRGRTAAWTSSSASPHGSNSRARVHQPTTAIAQSSSSVRAGSSRRLQGSLVAAPVKRASTPSPANTPRGRNGSQTPPVAPPQLTGTVLSTRSASADPSQRTIASPVPHTQINSGVVGGRTPMAAPPQSMLGIASATVIAAAAAAAATAAQRSASPNTVVQSLQRLETVRCQAQSEFWAV